jgi:serine kinase of HPr protein (carbohydrate metabolism regulator)
MTLLHATCVSLNNSGVLLRGPSGVGKSDLALQLIDQGARLVADDYVALSSEGNRLVGATPHTIRGLLEVRGVGVMEVPSTTSVLIRLVVDLVTGQDIPRLPEPGWAELEGVKVSRITVSAREASAAAKIRLALNAAQTSIRFA